MLTTGLAFVARPLAGNAQTALPGRVLRATGRDRVWRFDGVFPGPTLRLRRGEALRIPFTNELAEETAVHWHGVRVENAMDGIPYLTQPPVPSGGSFEYRLTPPDAGTYWYHAPPSIPGQADHGLAGLLIVDEPEPPRVDRDIALLFSDKIAPAPNPSAPPEGAQAWTVNGLRALDIPVRTNERLRLRLLNASPARLIRLRFEGHRAVVMAIDGQPAEAFTARNSALLLGPGNRIDVFIDAALSPGAAASILLSDGAVEMPIAGLRYAEGAPARPEPLPDAPPLPANPLPARIEFRGAEKIDIALGRSAETPQPGSPKSASAAKIAALRTLDGSAAALREPPLFQVKRGRAVMLSFANRAPVLQMAHLHGHCVRLLDRLDDGWKPFWLDTIALAPGEVTRTAFVADNPGKWLIGCRPVGGSTAQGGWFEVT